MNKLKHFLNEYYLLILFIILTFVLVTDCEDGCKCSKEHTHTTYHETKDGQLVKKTQHYGFSCKFGIKDSL